MIFLPSCSLRSYQARMPRGIVPRSGPATPPPATGPANPIPPRSGPPRTSASAEGVQRIATGLLPPGGGTGGAGGDTSKLSLARPDGPVLAHSPDNRFG